MPTYSFSPNQGESSNLTAQDRLRQANADRMIQMTLAQMQDARSANAMSAQERLGYAQIAGNKDMANIQGQYGLQGMGLQNEGALGRQKLANEGAANLADITGKYGLEGTKLSVGPQQTMADLARTESDRRYNDPGTAFNRQIDQLSLDYLKNNTQPQAGQVPNNSNGISMQEIVRKKMGLEDPIEVQMEKAKKMRAFQDAMNPGQAEVREATGEEAKRGITAKKMKDALEIAQPDIDAISNRFSRESYLSDTDTATFLQLRNSVVRKLKDNGITDPKVINSVLDRIKTNINVNRSDSMFEVGPQAEQIQSMFNYTGM